LQNEAIGARGQIIPGGWQQQDGNWEEPGYKETWGKKKKRVLLGGEGNSEETLHKKYELQN